MLIKNATYTNADFKFTRGDILCENGIIKAIGEALTGDDVLTLPEDSVVLPGFIDIHTHGCAGADTGDATHEAFDTMSKYHATHGVTSFCPTTMTDSEQKLIDVFTAAAAFSGKESGAYIHGINMEGPYISYDKKGAQPEEFIRKPSLDEFAMLNSIFRISLIDVAPEAEGAAGFASVASKICTVSAAHSNADEQTALKAYKSGFSHATHLFNAMSGMNARNPGVAGVALDMGATCELICDGFHVSPTMLSLAFKLLGRDRAVVVSDSMRSAGLPDGEYTLGAQTVYVKDGKARLADGTIAASTSNLHEEFLNLLDFGIEFEQALRACTINPARVIGVSEKTGSIKINKQADFVILDSNFDIHTVIIGGKVAFTAHD